MAEVFAATDVRLGRAVAIKVLRFDDTAARDRFEREMRLLARLDHPGLVRVFDAGEDGDDAFFVMEMVEGDTLAERLAAGPLATEETAKLGAAVADALAFIHADGVVHRDVKPSNILLGRDDRPRLADFGIARLTDATALTSTGLTVGTAAYIAPEQFVGQRARAARRHLRPRARPVRVRHGPAGVPRHTRRDHRSAPRRAATHAH